MSCIQLIGSADTSAFLKWTCYEKEGNGDLTSLGRENIGILTK